MKRLVTTIAMLSSLVIRAAAAASIDLKDVYVIDGDTIRVYNKKPNVRLVGFNAPETRNVCQAERELGQKAKRRLQELVQGGNLDFEFIPCNCPEGSEGTEACNHGRRCGTLKSSGRDVGAILIEQEFAVPFVCTGTRCPPTPSPWCGDRPSRRKACGNEWQNAKEDPTVKARGWPAFLSACLKRFRASK